MRIKTIRSRPNGAMAAQPREEKWSITAAKHWQPAARPPQPRESDDAHHHTTGLGAEGGGGWPMHATAQPWHAEDGRRRPEPCGARSAQRQGRPTPSIEQLLARQLLDAQSSSLPRSEGPETPNLLTFLLTPKAAGRKTSVTARILGFYNQSLLSSRSMVRIHQGAYFTRRPATGRHHHQATPNGA
jgi:hypothetical protein